MCGEKPGCVLSWLVLPGSPPRVRGKVNDIRFRKTNSGITPACAGKSTKQEKQQGKARDHPRVCGEKDVDVIPPAPQIGSPPRVRGKVSRLSQLMAETGITPACAGKSTTPRSQAPALGDHPRVCGEKRLLHFFGFCVIGSPPRVRGKAVVILLCVATFRITPACAGKRSTMLPQEATIRDHPRVCGEK